MNPGHPLGDEVLVGVAAARLSFQEGSRLWACYYGWVWAPEEERRWARIVLDLNGLGVNDGL